MTIAQRPVAIPTTVPPQTVDAARAVFGLVDDQYGVVAHTPNLTRDAAAAIARAVSVGDPTVPVDDALSFLDVPDVGIVCTRYATRLDARGRLAMTSDSVVLDYAAFATLRADPLRCMPRKGDVPNPGDALDVPRFTASHEANESTRLVEARRAIDERRELRPLLAALLAGDRVLLVASDAPSPQMLQCLVLLLPPSLRAQARSRRSRRARRSMRRASRWRIAATRS